MYIKDLFHINMPNPKEKIGFELIDTGGTRCERRKWMKFTNDKLDCIQK